jgi:hypothetical protein
MLDRRDSALIEAAADAARVTDDFVRGVIGLADGQIGDDNQQHSWLQRRLRGRAGQRSVARGMGGRYAPEQLRKAANEADEFVVAVAALADAWTPPALDAHVRLAALGAAEIPVMLRAPEIGSGSPQLRDVHDRLSRSIAILGEARTKAILAEMRAARGES